MPSTSTTRRCPSSPPPSPKRQRTGDLKTDNDNQAQLSTAKMTIMNGDFATGYHTRSQGLPPAYTEADDNSFVPAHQDLSRSGKPSCDGMFCSSLPCGHQETGSASKLTYRRPHKAAWRQNGSQTWPRVWSRLTCSHAMPTHLIIFIPSPPSPAMTTELSSAFATGARRR